MVHPDVSTAAADADAGPRRALLWALLAYAIAALTLGFPALTGQFLVNPVSDQYIAGYAFRDFAAQSLRETGSFPLWNPYIFGGMPYVAAMHGDIFYPTFLLRMILPTDVAMTWGFILHLFLAGLFTYGFLRRTGVGFAGSLVGGLAYMLSGQIASYASPGHDGKLFVSALLPLFLWALHFAIREGRHAAWGGIALIVGLGVLSPHPQLLQYMLVTGGCYALFLAFTANRAGERLERPIAVRRLVFSLIAIAVGGAIGAIQFWPLQEYVPWSPRAGGTGWDHATSFSMPLPELLVNTYLPQFTGILFNYTGQNGIHFHSEYLGVAVLFLAGLGLTRASGIGRAPRWFWIGALVVSALWALGGNTPFYHLIYALVPGTKFFRAPSTIFYVTSFAVAVLAAFGTDRLVRGRVSPRYAAAWVGAALVLAILASTGAMTNLSAALAAPGAESYALENGDAIVSGAWRTFGFVLAIAGVALLAARGSLRPLVAVGVVTLIVTADLWSIARLYWTFSPPAAELYASDPAADYVKALPSPPRVVARQLGAPQAPNDPFLRHDALWVSGVRNALGYHGNELGRYQILVGEDEGYRPVLTNPNIWALLNIGYMYTDLPDLPFGDRVVGPVRNAAGSEVYLYDLPGEQPAAWVAPAIVTAPDDQVLATVLDPRFDVYSVALMTDSADVASAELNAAPARLTLPVTVTRPAPGRIDLALAEPAPEGSAVVVSENYYPGWTATVDGQPAPVWRTNYVLMGVPLAAGATNVSLTFTNPPYEQGKVVTLLALLVSIALLAGGVVLDRRRLRG